MTTYPTTLRRAIVGVCRSTLPALTVYDIAPAGALTLPAVLVSMAARTPGPNDRHPKWTVTVSVAVARGTDDSAAIEQLETIWPAVYDALDAALPAAGIGAARMGRVVPAPVQVNNESLPGVHIEIDTYGR